MSELKEEQVVTDAPQPDEEGVELPTTPSITGETSSQSGETAIPQPSVEDMAAHDYQSLIPVFYKYVDFMSKKQLRNLMKALVEYPLERDQPKLAFEDERKAFYFGMQIFDCKFVIMKAVMELQKNKANMEKFKQELDKQTQEGVK